MRWLWEAFWELSSTRARGFGAQPLQHAQIVAYCELKEFDKGEVRVLAYAVLAMDHTWMEWAEKKKSGDGSES